MSHDRPNTLEGTHLSRVIAGFVDPDWYRKRYPDIDAAGLDPVRHFLRHGIAEGRDPNRFFDTAWYLQTYRDAAASGAAPLLHYLLSGASEARNPHPRFDADFYTHEHPEAASNPLLFHLRVGHSLCYPTEKPFHIGDYQPSDQLPPLPPEGVVADIVIPVHGGADDTQSCLNAVLADSGSMPGRVIVVEDCCPDAALVAWLQQLADAGRITLLRNRRPSGFAASVNRGMAEAGDNDVVLLSSDTEFAAGWLTRLAAHAYAAPRIAAVSPLSNVAATDNRLDDPDAPLPFGHSLDQIDEVCRTVNSGRFVQTPSTQAICLYIRRTALNELGDFDAEGFPLGHDSVTDFCLRADAKGWTHRLACDTFVHRHPRADAVVRHDKPDARAAALLQQRYPGHPRHLAGTVRFSALTAYRFAMTAALFRLSGLPVILMATRGADDGVRRHIGSLMARFHDKARFLLLEIARHDITLSVPALPGHPRLVLPVERDDQQEQVLRAMHVSRLHIHDLNPTGLDIKALVRRLGVPFDITVHDYLAICPQRNLLPWQEGLYCGEPGPAHCNACIADANGINHGARDILSWRLKHAWQFLEADRVICPSHDTKRRLQRYGLAERAVVAPHDAPAGATWPVTVPAYSGPVLRIVVLGALTNPRGARTVAMVAEAARRSGLAIHLIGYTDDLFPQVALRLVAQTGRYEDSDLPDLIRQTKPHVFWFASTAPETDSEALGTAIETGLPIVATDLGAFTERLSGRPLTWLVDHRAPPDDLMAVFEQVRQVLASRPDIAPTPRPANRRPAAMPDFYARDYLAKRRVVRRTPSRLRRILALPARQPDGSIAPSGYTRLLQPLDHPAIGGGHRLELADASTFTRQSADIVMVQPAALSDAAAAEALIAYRDEAGGRLVLDLDADPAESGCAPKVLRRLLQAADAVWVASAEIGRRIAPIRAPVTILETKLDERIWQPRRLPTRRWDTQTRILWVGGADDENFALIETALVRLKSAYGDKVAIDILGLDNRPDLPDGLHRLQPSDLASRSYPAFVHWFGAVHPGWHIGLAPLRDRPANSAKSPVQALEYAASGMLVLASDTPVYRGTLADGPAGQLVANTPSAWYAAIDWMIRDEACRHTRAARSRLAFEETGSLAAAAAARRAALEMLFNKPDAPPTALRRPRQELHLDNDPDHTPSGKRRHSGRRG
ncbi:MAG: hypothetical protein B7Z80_22560 [Rhodospirillales bacterium 20-64-7]|nr:MAG: hypothetical protein B7Z80_22560 [Rhodospirillales bacterium 20-64-7]HQT78714.1 glycosyltransferase [Rhodopila sp.]